MGISERWLHNRSANAEQAKQNIDAINYGRSRKIIKDIMGISYIMTNDEMREIQTQQDELTRKLNEKISDDLSKFQKTMDEIFKQKQIRQREYFIQKINIWRRQTSSTFGIDKFR